MSKIDRNLYYKQFAHVSVNDMVMSHTSKCNKCESKFHEFTVFLGEGQRLSTMYSSCCSDCLPIVVKEAIDEGRKTAEEQIARAEQRLYKESLELVRKTKLNNIERITK